MSPTPTEGRALVVDADAHINEPVVLLEPDPAELAPWQELAERHPGWIGPGRSGGKVVSLVEGRCYPTQEGKGRGVPVESALHPLAGPASASVSSRLADLDSEGIDVQVLYGGLSLGVTSFSDPGLALDFARAYNDWLAGVCARAKGRLAGVAVVPLQDVAASVAEAERAKGLGLVGVTVPPVLGERNLDDPSLLGFFEAAAGLDLAVGVHGAPGMHLPLPGAERFDNYAQVHALSFPVDQMVAFTALTMGGVLDRFPTLRVAFLESGVGWVPYYVDRVREHREKRGELLPAMRSDPREYLERGQCFFAFECEDPFVGHFVEHLGASSLVFSSDYPHWDCEFPGAVDKARAENRALGDEVLEAALGRNAERLYRLPAVVSSR
jgi:predicted TIM-barrel fold metal-dependent hydrolase